MHQRGISAITSESFPFKLLALKASHDNHLRVNEEGNCSESVLESREPGGTISGYRYYILVFYIYASCFRRYYKLCSKKVIYSIPLWKYT